MFVTEECLSGVLVSCGRFVCGPANDWNRIFYTYDLASGVELAKSSPYTYNGTPMTRVPGREAFITVTTNLSPSDFHFYRVDSGGAAVFTAESPYHGDFPITNTYAFRGRPATHLVNSDGRFLKLTGCATAVSNPATDCLVQDGTLGTLKTSEYFAGMETGGDGYLYGVVTTAPSWGSPICAAGCRVQRVDMTTRTIASETALPTTSIHKNLRLRHDAWSGRAIIAGDSTCSASYPYDCTGWSVWLAAY
jgi:hypothetical protein